MPLHFGDPVMQTDGRMDGRMVERSRVYYVTTKISWLDRLQNFLSNGASLQTKDKTWTRLLHAQNHSLFQLKSVRGSFVFVVVPLQC